MTFKKYYIPLQFLKMETSSGDAIPLPDGINAILPVYTNLNKLKKDYKNVKYITLEPEKYDR